MPPITVLNNEFASLWYHPETKIIHHKIHRFIDSRAFRELLSTGAEYLEKHHAKKWLSDDRDSVVIRDDDAMWGETVWGPRVVRAGFKYWAIVLPAAAIGQLNMRRLAQEYRDRGVTVEVFGDLDSAMNWISAR